MSSTAVRETRRPALRDGDFAGAYRSTLGSLVAYFRAKGLGAEDARDLAHETVLRTLVHLKRHGRTRSELGPLTKTIARNLLVERVRRPTPFVVPLTDAHEVADDGLEPADEAVATERREAVRAALRELTPRHRRVVELWMEGRTPAEIAQQLGIKRNAADAILHRARRALASKLGPRALWGAVVLAWLRARTSARDAAQTIAPWSPASAAVAPAGISLVAVGLAAVFSFGTPDASTTHSRPSHLVGTSLSSSSSTDTNAAKAPSIRKVVSSVSPASTVATPVQREVAIGVGTQDDEDAPVTVGVALRPDEDGDNGVVGPLAERLIAKACNVKSACGEDQ